MPERITAPESRYTEPRPDCRRPDYWHSDDSDSTEHEVTELVAAFVRALQPECVVETGSAWGQTTYAIGQALLANGHGELISLEVDRERVEFSRNKCAGLPVSVLQLPSLQYLPHGPIGFAWFDSLFELRVKEFLHFGPWLIKGSVVGFHDTGPQHPLRPDIEELAVAGLIAPIFLPTPRGVCFATVL